MNKWRIPEDTDFTGIPDDELEAACLWEMLRQLSAEQRSSLSGIYADAAISMLEVWPVKEPASLSESWAELDLTDRRLLKQFSKTKGASIREGEFVRWCNRTICHQGHGEAPPVPNELALRLTERPTVPDMQIVGLEIDWRRELTSIRRDIQEWLAANAPDGTPGHKGIPDPKEPAKGRHTTKQFRAGLDWISYSRLIEREVPIRDIANKKPGLYPSSSTVRQAPNKLAKRYRDWLGVTFS